MAALAISVTGGRKAFRRGDTTRVAFTGVDLELRSGEIVALLGPSGCGKSTLLRSLAGLEHLDAGRIEIGPVPDPAHAVGIAFQQPSLLPWLTVAGNVALGLRFAANRHALARGVVDRAIAELGLESVADAFPDELSGGQAQRANVGRLVVTGRPILLLDEPFASLDPVTRVGLQDWLVELQRARGLSLLVVTHDVAEALRLGDRVALMSGAPGTVAQVWDIGAIAGPGRDPGAIAALRGEITRRYDVDRSPEIPPQPWTARQEVIELEGALG